MQITNKTDDGTSTFHHENFIQHEGVKFFRNLLAPNISPSTTSQVNEIIESIPNMISSQDYDMLMAPFTTQ